MCLRRGIGLLPMRCSAEADLEITERRRDNLSIGQSHGHCAHQRLVLHRPAEHAERVDAARVVMHAERDVIAIARLVADAAVEGGRTDDRTAGLRSVSDRHHEIGDRRPGAAGGARRRMRRVMGILGLAGCHVSEFGRHRLAKDQAALRTALRDAGRVVTRMVLGVDDSAVPGRHVLGIDDVLYADRHAADQTAGRACIDGPSIRHRLTAVEIYPSLDLRLAGGVTFQASRRHRLACGLARLDLSGDLARRYFPKFRHRRPLRIAPFAFGA